LILIAAKLVGSWVAISIVSRSVRNRDVSRSLTVIAWPIAALAIVGLLDDLAIVLDAAAITVGTSKVSLLIIAKGAIVFAVLLWLASLGGSFAEHSLSRASDLTPTFQVLSTKLIKALLIVLAVVFSLSAVGIDLTALAVFSGALGLGIGFGLQKVASNLISGVIILMDRSIKPGDVISLGETFGWIVKLQSRYVSVVTRDGVEHLIPNETFISESVVNWSHSNRHVRLEIRFGTSYGDDPHRTREVTVAAVAGLDRVLKDPKPVCHVVGFGDSSVDFVMRFWVQDPENGVANISGQAYLAVWDAFKHHGITIPFPHREVFMRTAVKVQNDT
jgi:small-conductance mechanosensitive channel